MGVRIMQTKLTLWQVTFSNMYYVCGLPGESEDELLLTFSPDQTVAFLFSDKYVASQIADVCCGEVLEIALVPNKLFEFEQRRENFLLSDCFMNPNKIRIKKSLKNTYIIEETQ